MHKFIIFCILLIISSQAAAFESDKHKHLSVGVFLGVMDWKLGCGAGAIKETFDTAYDKNMDFADFAYTCGGSLLADKLAEGKSDLYRWDVAMIMLDGISTDNAIRQGAREAGFPKYVLGEYPTTPKLAAFTALKLWLLNESESWRPRYRKAFQWTIAITGPPVVYWNFSQDFNQ